jgi:hypothetical protein
MRLYPYSNIQTNNLKPLLISARILGLLSYLLFIGALVVGLIGLLGNSPTTYELSGGIQATWPAQNTAGPAIILALWSAVSSLCILAFSGLCAAVVSCEYKYTSSEK